MKDLERKAEISKFIHVVATQGYPKAGREVGSQNATNEAKATSPQENTILAVTCMATLYPKMPEGLEQIYGTTKFASVDLAAAAFKMSPEYASAREEVDQFCNELKKKYPDMQFTIAAELCPETYKAGVVRLHYHVLLKRQKNLILKLPSELKFQGTTVHLTRGVIDRRNCAKKVNEVAYYCSVNKIGSVETFGSYVAWANFVPNPNWVTSLAAGEKITLDTARKEYIKCTDRAEHYVRNIEWIMREKREAREEAERLAVAIHIRSRLKPMRVPPTYLRFLEQFKADDKYRFKFYVLDGPSGLGKTEFVRLQYPIGALLELNCQNTTSPNWRLFNREQHQAILLDEATPELCLAFKKEVQADNTIVQEGTSGTNVYSYKCWFYRVHFIVCCNRWNANLWWLWSQNWDDWDWLNKNTIVEEVDDRTFDINNA